MAGRKLHSRTSSCSCSRLIAASRSWKGTHLISRCAVRQSITRETADQPCAVKARHDAHGDWSILNSSAAVPVTLAAPLTMVGSTSVCMILPNVVSAISEA